MPIPHCPHTSVFASGLHDAPAPQHTARNMQVFHGSVISCDQHDHLFQYLVEDQGRIVHTGDELPEAYRGAPIVELGQHALVPAFGDGHIHFSNWALIAGAFLDVRQARDFGDLGALIREHAARRPAGKVLAAFGASRHSVREQRLITRAELDAIESELPVYIICYDGHSSIGNSRLVELMPDRIRRMRGFDADTGLMLHEAYYGATDHVSGSVPALTLLRSVASGYDRLAAAGIGLIHAVEGIGFPRDLDVTMVSHIARAMARRKGFQTRIYFQTMDVAKVRKRKLPRIGGCFATALDGCFGVCDAALIEPYAHQPDNKGILFHSDREVIEFVKQANRAGLQVSMHAIGDAAVAQALRAFEEAHKDFPRQDARHVLIHACLLPPDALERCAKLGVGITLQPAFLISPLEPASWLRELLGSRLDASSPLRSIVQHGIHLSGGSDGPVTLPDPIEGIYGACNHPYDSGQSVTIPQALKMFTSEVAWMSFDERDRGTLEPGKLADMTVLSANPLAWNPKELRKLKVEALYLGGQRYEPGISAVSLLSSVLVGDRVTL